MCTKAILFLVSLCFLIAGCMESTPTDLGPTGLDLPKSSNPYGGEIGTGVANPPKAIGEFDWTLCKDEDRNEFMCICIFLETETGRFPHRCKRPCAGGEEGDCYDRALVGQEVRLEDLDEDLGD